MPCRRESRSKLLDFIVRCIGSIFERDAQLTAAIENLSLKDLMSFEWQELPLGPLCLPGLRWILRIHHLNDDEPTRYLLREYILSAWNIAQQFSDFLDKTQPRAVVVFNGQFYPEAIARYISQRRGIRVITHEVGLQPATAFFTDGEATAYPIHIPDEFELNDEQNAKLDAYLARRFQGDFTMAGIKFWADMKGLDESFLQKQPGSNRSCQSLPTLFSTPASRTPTPSSKICSTGSTSHWM